MGVVVSGKEPWNQAREVISLDGVSCGLVDCLNVKEKVVPGASVVNQ